MKNLSPHFSTIYADLLQQLSDRALTRGSFVSKQIGPTRYWYLQTDSALGRRQKSLGAETVALLETIQLKKAELLARQQKQKKLVALAIVAGGTPERGRNANILQKIADAGVFDQGGMLVGSFAFTCYGNMLGVADSEGLSKTEDMDISVMRMTDMTIVLSRNLSDLLLETDVSFRRPVQINPRIIPFELVSSDGFKVKFLTTKEDISEISTIHIPRFGVYAQPLEFMDYLLQQPQQAVVLYQSGVLVTVPEPAYFALHKLALSQLRPAMQYNKSRKDLSQAGFLIQAIAEFNPGALLLAAEAVFARQDGLPFYVAQGMKALPDEVKQHLLTALGYQPTVEVDTQTGFFVTEKRALPQDFQPG